MSQKIKKQIKRSIPYFMIFSLIVSTTISGLVFNLDFKIIKTVNDHLGLEVSVFEAQADFASTTVTVKNAAPSFTGNPVEAPASAAASPINVGANAIWTAVATDPELNNFFLIVCASDSVTPTNGAAPVCGGGIGDTFCVSGAAASAGTATCLDAALADPGAETDIWYAFVCDDHATEADCSLSDQGSGDSGSPIYINHEPLFASVVTSVDNRDPSAFFTVIANTTDGDTEDQLDELILDVCESNSWATSTGCVDDTWCTATSTTGSVTCDFASSTPARDGTYSYYAFIQDWHGLPAPVNGRTTTYTINNVAPSVSNVVINGGDPINVELKGDGPAWASSTADLYDANGCVDIVSASSSIYLSTVTGGLNCAADDNDCYQLPTTECVYVPGSCANAAATTASYICSTTIEHFASPSDTSTNNPNVLANWLAGVTATDDDGLQGSAVSITGVELISSLGLGIDEDEIPYGQVKGNTNSGAYNATTTVVNFGNIPIDTEIRGDSMDKTDLSDVIVESNQKFDLINFTYLVGTYTLSSTTPESIDTVIPNPTSLSDVSDEIYWGINIPGGTSSGDYAGENTFTARIDGADWQ